MDRRQPRTKVTPPTSVEEALTRMMQLQVEIRDIDLQFQTPARLARKHGSFQESVSDAAWHHRASYARRKLEAELSVLQRWVKEHGPAARQPNSTKKVVLAQLSVLEGDAHRLRFFLSRARDLLQTLETEGVDFDTSEKELLEQVDHMLSESDALKYARNCRGADPQERMVTMANITLTSRDAADLELLRRDVDVYRAASKDRSGGENEWRKVVKAFLACGDLAGVLAVLPGRADTRPSSRWVDIWSTIYEHSQDKLHLAYARELAGILDGSTGAPLGWSYVYRASESLEDWEKVLRAYDLFVSSVTDQKNADGVRIGLLKVLGRMRHRDQTTRFLNEMCTSTGRIEALCHVGIWFKDPSCLKEALEVAKAETKPPPFRVFRAVVKLCAVLGNAQILRAVGESTPVTMRYYALSIAAALEGKDTDRRSLLSLVEEVKKQQHGEEEWGVVIQALAWSLTVCGENEQAMDLIPSITSLLKRTIAYLAVHTVIHEGRTSIVDVAF